MLKLLVVGTIATLSLTAEAARSGNFTRPIHKDIVHRIKNTTAEWVPFEADENPLAGKTDAELKGMVGAIIDDNLPDESGLTAQELLQQLLNNMNNNNNNNSQNNTNNNDNNNITPTPTPTPTNIATSFDSRTQWGSCIHPVMNQGSCGSCWAFGATEVLSDRLCIASSGKVDVVLSPEALLSCDKSSYGCSGGYPQTAFAYLASTGVVSNACQGYLGYSSSCSQTCTSSAQSNTVYKCKSGTNKSITGISNMQLEIQTNGPVETTFNVYADFYNYKSGVYSYTSGGYVGGHAVKVIGWGVSGSTNYWIAQNSWGTSWGQAGYFYIKQGQLGFDNTMYACTPSV